MAEAAGTVSPEVVAALTEAIRATSVTPEGLDMSEAGRYCGISRTAFYELDRKGLCPAAVQIGDGPRRWLRTELHAWLAQGCPSRRAWAGMKASAMKQYHRQHG